MLGKYKNLIYIIASLVVFIIIAFVYAHPVLTGKELYQPDIVQYKGGAKELLDYRASQDEETYWSDAMFGGMPTYQMGAQFRGDIIKKIDGLFNIFPKPVNYLFLLFSGFFLLGMVCLKNNWKYALLGALFFGFSTYFYIIIGAGHNGKVHTIAYFAPLVAGILLIYIRQKYALGFIITSLFMGLQIAANHPQMTYYLFLALAFLFISELIRVVMKRTHLKHFLISTGLVGLACVLGVGMNSQRIMANSEYIKETVRGKQLLNNEKHTAEKSGMDKESILAWSYGKAETLNLFIPRLMGGASNEQGAEEITEGLKGLLEQNITDEEDYNRTMKQISKGLGSITYWGDQPMTSGPAYQGGVVVFLAILGFFFAPKKYRYWVLGASALSIMLAWGANFLFLSDFFIDFVPFYNKFRAPSSILVVVELLFPLIGIIGLYQILNRKDETSAESHSSAIKKLLYITASVVGATLILLLLGKSILGFSTANENAYLPPYIVDFLVDARYKMFREDAIKAIIFVLLTAGAIYFALKKKISTDVALLIIGVVSVFDLWTVNRRYLNSDNFVDKVFAQNPFQTEVTDLLIEKAGENPNLQSMLRAANLNKTLETIAEKDKGHYRIFNQTLGAFSETNTSYFKSSIGGYHAVKLRRYDDLINEYFYSADSLRQQQIPEILNMLNVKYIVGGSLAEPQVQINPLSNGNAWFVSDLKFAKTPNEEIDLIGKTITKRQAIISEEDKSYFKGKPLKADSTASIELISYQPNAMELKTQSQTPQLAVFSEVYYPHGWTMLLDGKEVPYIKANYLLRAVYVPAGEHSLKMTFAPKVIETGKTLSLISFILFLVLSAVAIGISRRL
ncbi:YfhO family protein [Bergeyella cardium]|uniref:YfhO family protein n=1 Tax=Bergeyella cardium TaxID=1585976 RepID=A0A6P1QTH2_9FLAO|nr:YfhO family protein [Bergeyella cardium]QHN65412.1 YfhO family protein [Bergeyella cardium]WHE32990.1 YfhO family protein [Bergeyella cardium]WHF59642.1 YfhO family protein [Bergeyella cardium]